MKKIIILIPIYNDWESLSKLLNDINQEIENINNLGKKIMEIEDNQGVIYTGNPKILKKICPGIFGTIKPVGYCMIGKK